MLYTSAAFLDQTLFDESFFDKAWIVIKQYLGSECHLNSDNFRLKVEELQAHLKNLRDDITTKIAECEEEYKAGSAAFSRMIDTWLPIVQYSNKNMVEFAESVMQTAKVMLKTPPPCSFVAVAIGSLGRGEATPFSDLEYLFLIEDSSHKEYFKRLAVASYFVIGSLRETRLESIDIEELKVWFVDGRAAGFQIDGITQSSGNVPTRNSKAPDQFIATPEELINVYEQALLEPSPTESIRGDVTSMLRFTTSIFSYNGGEQLLKRFTTMRKQLDGSVNRERTKANLAMLSSDILKHKFSPEFCEYSAGFPLSVKKMLYRFPSLLLLDFTVVLGQDGLDSWEIINCWLAESGKSTVNSFPQSLCSALVYACFSRLRCYHIMGSASGVVEIDRRLADTVSPYGDPKHKFIFERSRVATLSDHEFLSLCEAFLQLQGHVKPVSESSSTVEGVRGLLQSEVKRDISCSVLAKFFSCKWLDVVHLVDDSILSFNERELLYAKARSLLELRMFTDALTIYQRLMGDQGHLNNKPFFKLDVLRGMARCYKGKGQLRDADQVYKRAFKLCQPEEDEDSTVKRKDFAQLKMEYAISMSRLTLDKTTALDMLFDALGDLILDVAMANRKNTTQKLIWRFHTSTSVERLGFCCNPTREIAHCVFAIAEIFEFAGKSDLAAQYFQKARVLGLKIVADKETDDFTQALTMHELGEKYQAKKYLDKALEFQKQLPESDHRVKRLGLDIHLSQCACGVASREEPLEQLPEDEELGVNPDDSSLQSEEELNQLVERTTKLIDQVHDSKDHQDYGKLHKLKADIGKKTGADETTVLENYSKAREIFDKNDSKLEGATVRNAEAEILIGRNEVARADNLLKEAQMKI